MKIGIQVSSLKPLLLTEQQVDSAFARMRELGCGAVQLQWIDPNVPLEAVAKACEGMESLGTQDFYDLVCRDFEYYVNLNRLIKGKYLCVSRIPDRLKSEEKLPLYIEELRQMQKKLDAFDQKICFHPVSADYRAVPGMDVVGWLLDNMPELELCLDLYHLNKNCADMPGFIRRYAGRIPMVHFKDGIGDTLVPAGQGDTRWDGVVRACLDADVGCGLAEQEAWEGDPFECLKQAMDWIEGEMEGCKF